MSEQFDSWLFSTFFAKNHFSKPIIIHRIFPLPKWILTLYGLHEIWRFGLEICWISSSFFKLSFANLLSTKMCNTFWDILYFALTRTQTTKLALKNALHFTSHSLKLASSEKTSKSKVCGTQQQEDACYLVYLIINTTFIILWNKIGFSWKWESRKQGPEGL